MALRSVITAGVLSASSINKAVADLPSALASTLGALQAAGMKWTLPYAHSFLGRTRCVGRQQGDDA
jgi:hypothetical protein